MPGSLGWGVGRGAAARDAPLTLRENLTIRLQPAWRHSFASESPGPLIQLNHLEACTGENN